MKKFLAASVLAATLAVPAVSNATQWDIDPVHTISAFSVRHMMVSNVRGEFGKTTGTVNIDDKDVTKSTVDVTIDASSITTRNDQRDTHLKSEAFFDVANHPTITFKSTKIEKKKGDKYSVTGDLTMRGVTKSVILDVDFPKTEVKDPYGNTKRGATATTKVNRQDYKIAWQTKLDGGGVVVGDEVAVDIAVELTKHVDAPATAASPKPSPAPSK